MHSTQRIVMFTYILQYLSLISASQHHARCKAAPGTSSWPLDHEWARLNTTLSGQLLKPSPPGAVCHPTQSTFDPLACPAVLAGWQTTGWHSDDPVSVSENNWNNDTCLPVPTYPCSGQGYPIYVVNATCATDVKKGVDFAREKNIRLIVKGTGHDYLGRSSAPNSLSIWTHNLRGLAFHDGFRPKGCRTPISGHAVTAAAGTQMLELDEQAHLRNLTIVGGGAGTVGIVGYLTGGGHSALSSTYGLGVDQILEIEMVSPGSEILTTNECQHTDLFWATRGGGGSTFGVVTSITIKAHPSATFVTANFFFGTYPGNEAYWDAISYVISRFPELDDQGISCYSFIVPGFLTPNATSPVNVFYGIFMLPLLHPSNSSQSLAAALNKISSEALGPYPGQFVNSVTTRTYSDFWEFYKDNNGPLGANHDQVLGSRLLDGKAIANQTAVKETYKALAQDGDIVSLYLVGGKNVWNAKPRGGSNSVHPAWRKAYIHTLVGVQWAPFDSAGQAAQRDKLTNVWVEALRKLAPDTGAYINEADPSEPNFQQAFWGENYPRLLEIKRKVDPADVFWCTPCVGNERWEEVDGLLCKL